jgi:hypothetical protein
MMAMPLKKPLLAALIFAATALPVRAQTEAIDNLPVSAIFVVSSGMWEEHNLEPVKGPDGQLRPPPATPSRGYYKVVAIRQGDGTAKVYLQRIATTANGPNLLENIELEEFSQMKSYVTDIRPESSNGASASPGLFVTVYLKTDPQIREAESWTILIDELGEMKIEKASN